MDIPGTVGGSTAYVGFTGAYGRLTAIQDILNWSYIGPSSAYDNRIAGNVITGNSGPGVAVVGTASVGNDIAANSIFGNTGQAIDLGDDGVTENAAAPRQGPNDLQNFPTSSRPPAASMRAGWGGASRTRPFASMSSPAPATAPTVRRGAGLPGLAGGDDRRERAGDFAVPFTAPAGPAGHHGHGDRPQGNTSEVSALRTGSLQVSPPIARLAAGQQR